MKPSYLRLLLLSIVCLAGLVTVFFLFPANVADKKTAPTISQDYFAGSFKIQVAINPEQPRVGKNQLTLIIRDKDNQTVSNANIKAVAEMPAMGSMPTMYAPAEMSNEQSGIYRGQFELPMTGAWPLTITIDSATHGQAKLSLNMGTSQKGLTISSATPGTFSTKSGQGNSLSVQPKSFKVDPYRRQLIGVTTEKVIRIKMKKIIHANAKISYDQTRLTDINLKFDGWINALAADYVGKQVNEGQALFTVYSPELISSQDEYLYSYKRSLTGQSSLKAAAARRLSLWGISHTQIRALEKRGRPLNYFPVLSPISGVIIEKNIIAGAAFKASSTLLRIADLSTIWVEGQIYESDLPWIKPGMTAQVITENKQKQTPLSAKITFIEPFLDNQTRTARVRAELANPDGLFRPDQYVQLQLQVSLGERLVVPEQAVLFSGENRVVFIDLGEGQLQAQKIKTGVRNNQYIEVTEGLNNGDVIVSSGNFLIASESKLKSGNNQW